MIPPARSWEEVPACVDARTALAEYTVYGISRALCAKDLYVDFGEGWWDTALSKAKLVFVTNEAASAAYCKGLRLQIKVVEHPEHEERPLSEGVPDPVLAFRNSQGVWSEYPGHTRIEWLCKVTAGTIQMGYWEWVREQVELKKYHEQNPSDS